MFARLPSWFHPTVLPLYFHRVGKELNYRLKASLFLLHQDR